MRAQPKRTRRGIATLEFALSLPLLLLSAAVAFGFGTASIASSDSAVKARHDAWKARASVRSDTVFNPSTMPDADRSRREASERFSVSGALAFIDRTASARNTVQAVPWDHTDAPFKEPDTPFTPHIEHIDQLVKGAASAAPDLLTDPADLADFAQIGQPGASSIVASALSGFTGSATGSNDKSSGSDGKPTSADKLSKVPGSGSSASDLSGQTSKLSEQASKAGSGSLGGVTSLSKGAAKAQNVTLAIAAAIFEGVDAALDPLGELTGALDDFVGGGDSIAGKITSPIKKAEEAVLEEVVGVLGGKDAKKNVKKLVDLMEKIEKLRESGSPFKKLARAAQDRETEDDDEFSLFE